MKSKLITLLILVVAGVALYNKLTTPDAITSNDAHGDGGKWIQTQGTDF